MGRPTLWITLWKRSRGWPKTRMEIGGLGERAQTCVILRPMKTSTCVDQRRQLEKFQSPDCITRRAPIL